MAKKTVLITDVDNTLLDWQELWFQSFSAMIDSVIEISGVARDVILEECRRSISDGAPVSTPISWKNFRLSIKSV